MRPAERGSVLIGIVFSMLIIILMAVTGVSMYADQAFTSLNIMRMAEANGTRLGVTDAVARILRADGDRDWSNLPGGETTFTLGRHDATVTYTDRLENSATVTIVTEAVEGLVDATKEEEMVFYRVPQTFFFTLFRGEPMDEAGNVTETLVLDDVQVTGGVFYTNGNVDAASPSAVNLGEVYYAEGSDVNTPAGTIEKLILNLPPVPSQPNVPSYEAAAATNSYEARAAAYAGDIADALNDGKQDIVVPPGTHTVASLEALENPNDGDGVVEARDFVVAAGDVTISGSGKIVAWRSVYFQNGPEAPVGAEEPGQCRDNGDDFKTSDGGCKRLTGGAGVQNKVWSAEVHDSRAVPPTGAAQAVAAATCDALEDGGYMDWELPTEAELLTIANALALGHVNVTAENDEFFWSTTTAVDLTDGEVFPLDPLTENSAVCVRDAAATDNGTTTVDPDEGEIEVVAGQSILKSDDTRGLDVLQYPVGDERAVFYASNLSPTDQIFLSDSPYNGLEAEGDEMLIIADRRIAVVNGFKLQFGRSVLYVREHADPTRNLLDISGAGSTPTSNNSTRVYGTLMSLSNRNPSLRLRRGTYVNGLVYAGGTTGRAEISNARVDGSMVARRYFNNTIQDAEFNGRSVAFLRHRQIPDGFGENISRAANTWAGE